MRTFCVVDGGRGFDPPAEVNDGQRLIVVEAWYPVDREFESYSSAVRATFGDYFAGDPDLLLRTERALLTTTGFAPDVIERNMAFAPAQFAVPRGALRNAPITSGSESFPVVLYSHGTLQQRFTNDTMAENLARRGYIVLAPEHTGNSALVPLGALCPEEMALPGIIPASLADNAAFDAARGEYIGQTFDPFFFPAEGDVESVINPREVALTVSRVEDYRAVLAAAPGLDGIGARADVSRVGMIGYSRGAMHGLVGAEVIDAIKVSVALVGGTPLRYFAKDEQAQPINDLLAAATAGERTVLDHLTKPVLDVIGGEDSRRKASTDASIGVYPPTSAENRSPIVMDTYATTTSDFRVVVTMDDIDHFDLVDDPFVVAYRAEGGTMRDGLFDPDEPYTLRPLSERQSIRDHYSLAALDKYLKDEPVTSRFMVTSFSGVSLVGEGY